MDRLNLNYMIGSMRKLSGAALLVGDITMAFGIILFIQIV